MKKIFVLTGEPSGDKLSSKVISKLQKIEPNIKYLSLGGENLKAIGRAGSGVNNIPIDKYTEQAIPVFNAPGANSNAVKELVLASILISARNIHSAIKYVESVKDSDDLKSDIEQGKKAYVGFELPTKTLGVIGLGKIGVKVANAAHDLGMNVIGYDPLITVYNAINLHNYTAYWWIRTCIT